MAEKSKCRNTFAKLVVTSIYVSFIQIRVCFINLSIEHHEVRKYLYPWIILR